MVWDSKRSYKEKNTISSKFSLTRYRLQRYRYGPVHETAKRYADFPPTATGFASSPQLFPQSPQVEIWCTNKGCNTASKQSKRSGSWGKANQNFEDRCEEWGE